MARDVAFTHVRTTWSGNAVRAAVGGASKAAVMAAAELILDDANKHVPFKTGILQKTGRVNEAGGSGTNSAYVSYDTPYAIRLHENPQYNFKNGREGKWLERALQRNGREVQATMIAYMRGAFYG